MLTFFVLIFSSSLGITVSNDGTCCSSKIVGNHHYTLLGNMDTTTYGCFDSCVYERADKPGSKFCFSGDFNPICQEPQPGSKSVEMKTSTCNVCVNGADYCDPTWLAEPNLNRALLGIDLAKRRPMPKNPEGDPSYPGGIIFNSAFRNTGEGNMKPFPFIHLTNRPICNDDFEESSWDTLEEFLKGSTKSSTSGSSIGYTGPKVTVSAKYEGIGVSAKIPPNSASDGGGSSDSSSKMSFFFNHERGSISHSKLKCSLYEVFVDIDDSSLSLHHSFIEAIKSIDSAITDDEKDYAMTSLISKFGTHYAKNTVMGIGVDFETRYTEGETMNHDKQTRNYCSSHSGGFSFLGFGKKDHSTKCTGSLEDTTQGDNTAVKRFTLTTYGTLVTGTDIADWSKTVLDMWKDRTLEPVPINQNLQSITDIFQTKAVAAIPRNDGSKIDVENLLKTAMRSLGKYCLSFGCDVPSCGKTLSLPSPNHHYIFEDYGRFYEGRPTFQDRNSENFLFYSENKWNIGPSFKVGESILSTSTCPHQGAVFESPIAGPSFPDVKSWLDCSMMCLDSKPPSPKCKYWQYDKDLNQCTLISDYSNMASTSSDIYTGTIDCPGDNFQFVIGMCVENYISRSMWVDSSSEGFLKGLKVQNIDPTSIIVAGGVSFSPPSFSDEFNNVDVIFQDKCYLPQMSDNNVGPNLVLTPDRVLLRCGGSSQSLRQTCDYFDVEGGVWKSHSQLRQPRQNSYAITVPIGTYIFAGDDSPASSEFLPANSNTWLKGPTIPGTGGIKAGCMVKVSATELLFIAAGNQVVSYNTDAFKTSDTAGWELKSKLRTWRANPSCAVIGNNVIVSGGKALDNTILSSTEIIPLDNYQPRPGGNMLTPRSNHRLITVGGRYPRLLALGGLITTPEGQLETSSSIEKWDDVNEEWEISPLQLKHPIGSFGALAVPLSTICP